MSVDSPRDDAAPSPVIRKRRGVSLVWLIPAITALIGGWLIVKTLYEQGPQITIEFKTAEGIEAGKTRIMFKSLPVGVVSSLAFSDDYGGVLLTADIDKEAERFLRRGTRFWVVKPRLGVRGVSGLSTLLTGAYIELEPGKGTAQRHFTGLENPPVVTADVAGTRIELLARRLGSLDIGSPVYYHGMLAGEVLGYELASDRKSVFLHAFVKSPYDQLVRGNTRFWHASGVDVSIGADGVDVRTESVLSLLFGGIAFTTPDGMEPVEDDVSGLVFTLHDSPEAIEEKAYTKKVRFVMFFQDSVRGLNLEAPVEFKGIKVGSVVDLHLEFDRRDSSFKIPVVIEIEPERVIERGAGDEPPPSPQETLQALVEQGLRARLGTGSLLTGQLFVELLMRPDTEPLLRGGPVPYPELPTVPAELGEITASVKGLLGKLDDIDFQAIGKELEGTLRGANQLANSTELRNSLRELEATMNAFRSVLGKVDRRVEPLADNIQQAVIKGRKTLELLDTLVQPDSELQLHFKDLTLEFTQTARSIRRLMEQLERNPQSLFYGKQ
jgi:paraquat-inducible protein B